MLPTTRRLSTEVSGEDMQQGGGMIDLISIVTVVCYDEQCPMSATSLLVSEVPRCTQISCRGIVHMRLVVT